MTPDDDLPAEVRRQDEEAELQIAAQQPSYTQRPERLARTICPRECDGKTKKPNGR